jgi:hypothetical protein
MATAADATPHKIKTEATETNSTHCLFVSSRAVRVMTWAVYRQSSLFPALGRATKVRQVGVRTEKGR